MLLQWLTLATIAVKMSCVRTQIRSVSVELVSVLTDTTPVKESACLVSLKPSHVFNSILVRRDNKCGMLRILDRSIYLTGPLDNLNYDNLPMFTVVKFNYIALPIFINSFNIQ